ncbi:MAG: LacI family DNA-binding transcriptional regulator [Phycisphaeraceae bacterium]|nr:LacI family DNA-binding transcriptional regulator [Phycisphaeraceae bacterium]
MSIGTVSGVLNGATNFAQATQRRIFDVAAELGYKPNLAAKQIRRNASFNDRPRTNILAHVTRTQDGCVPDPLVAARSMLLANLALKKNYYVLPMFYSEASAFACPPVFNGHVDGVLAGLPDVEIARTVSHLVPLILMDVPFSPDLLADVPRVNFDIRQGMSALAQVLVKQGHRQVAALTVNQDDPFDYHGVRCPLLRKACADAGLKLHVKSSRNRQLSMQTHDQVMDAFAQEVIPLIRQRKVTALMMVDDLYAHEMVARLEAAGIRVPEDVSVTGFADSPMLFDSSQMQLTTVRYPWAAMIDAALDLMDAEINGPSRQQGEILIRPELLVRDTTGALEACEANLY